MCQGIIDVGQKHYKLIQTVFIPLTGYLSVFDAMLIALCLHKKMIDIIALSGLLKTLIVILGSTV